jgi:hypothetical protein
LKESAKEIVGRASSEESPGGGILSGVWVRWTRKNVLHEKKDKQKSLLTLPKLRVFSQPNELCSEQWSSGSNSELM